MPTPRSIDYQRGRSLAFLVGLIVIGLLIVTMLIRGVDPIEVVATLCFAPIFVAMVMFGWKAGAGAGMAASGLYLALRFPAIELVGFRPLAGLIISRALGFVTFGAVGGWAAAELGKAIGKLEHYDVVDDATGLGNARALLDAIDRETARSDRHRTVFSVVVARFAASGSGRHIARTLRNVGLALDGGGRASDIASHLRENGDSLIVLLLPETGPEGAQTVARSLSSALQGLEIDAFTESWTMPGELDRTAWLTEVAQRADGSSRPRAAARDR